MISYIYIYVHRNIKIYIYIYYNVWIRGMEQRYGTDPSRRYGTGVWNGGMERVWSRSLFRTSYFDLHPNDDCGKFISMSPLEKTTPVSDFNTFWKLKKLGLEPIFTSLQTVLLLKALHRWKNESNQQTMNYSHFSNWMKINDPNSTIISNNQPSNPKLSNTIHDHPTKPGPFWN